jgi:NAD(P)-dependent dehydrogenase (short-subunit alcohol dehydrogenase family)
MRLIELRTAQIQNRAGASRIGCDRQEDEHVPRLRRVHQTRDFERHNRSPHWLEAFKVMVIGPFRVAHAFLNNLRKAADPKIMTVTSQIGATTWPIGGSYVYASAEAAVNRVMLAMTRDLKDQVTISLIHPGWVRTDMGGSTADLSVEESATGIRNVIASLTRADSGQVLQVERRYPSLVGLRAYCAHRRGARCDFSSGQGSP